MFEGNLMVLSICRFSSSSMLSGKLSAKPGMCMSYSQVGLSVALTLIIAAMMELSS